MMPRPAGLDVLKAGLEAAVGAVMIGAVLLNFGNVVARYVFLRPFAPAEEILQFMDVWIVMLGAATITREHRHLQMDVLYRALSPSLRRASDLLSAVLTLVLTGYVIVQALRIMLLLHGSGTRSVAASLPMALMYASMPLGFGCGALFLAARLRALAASHASAR